MSSLENLIEQFKNQKVEDTTSYEEPNVNIFDAPIPGQSLTDEPGNYPWEHPPKTASIEEAMDFVYESRWIQEQTLAKTVKDKDLKNKIMTKEEVYRFVMHYERLTHYILEELPKLSDIVLTRDGNFKFSISKTP